MTRDGMDPEEGLAHALAMNAQLGAYRRNAITAGRYRKRVSEAYPPEYFETRFRVEYPFGWGENNFVIISACATADMERDAVREAADDARLHAELMAFGCSPQRVTAYSPITGHARSGWAAPIGEIEAVRVGARFAQDVIHVLRRGTVWVAACRDDRAPAPVGPWAERVDAEG